MLAGHLVVLAAFLVQAHPQGLLFAVHIPDVDGYRGRDPREGVDHEPDQRPVPQADQGIGRDRADQLPGLGRRQDRRLALGKGELRPTERRMPGSCVAHGR